MISPDQVSAVIVTRGNVDLSRIRASLPYSDVVIWDNSKRPRDAKTYGRYLAMKEARHPVIYSQDDDLIFTAHDKLLAAYDPAFDGITTNMPSPWYERTHYDTLRCAMIGAGALLSRDLPFPALARYQAEYPADPLFPTYCDFVVGILTPYRRFDFGYEILPCATDPGRINTRPGADQQKAEVLARAMKLRDADGGYHAPPLCEWSGDRMKNVTNYDRATRRYLGQCPRCDGPVWSKPAAIIPTPTL